MPVFHAAASFEPWLPDPSVFTKKWCMRNLYFWGAPTCVAMHGRVRNEKTKTEGIEKGDSSPLKIAQPGVWVDGEWPDTLKKALVRLWQMYDEEKDKRIQEGIQHAEENYKLVQDKRELEKINNTLQKELGNSLSFHQVALVSEHQLELQKLLRQKAEKERDNLKEHKKKLEYYIADLLKAREVDKEKLKKISTICDE